MKAKYIIILISLIIANNALISKSNSTDSTDVQIILGSKIPMNDGIKLYARIWKPAGDSVRLPAIMWLTPYVSDEVHNDGCWFARRGYVFVSVDIRGRGNSEGVCYPMEQDGKDGAQAVEWIAKQSWCDGRVVMMGGSYRGMVQWQILREQPPSLKAISPSASVGPGVDYPQPRNIFYSYMARWLSFVSENADNRKLFGDSDYWSRRFYKMYSEFLPFAALDNICSMNFEPNIFQRWLSHPVYDDYWKSMTPSDSEYSKFNIPILTITGHFDDDQMGAMNYYTKHCKYGIDSTVKNHYLIVGPFDHGGTRRPAKSLGGLHFGDNALLDMNQIQLEWFDWILKGCKKPEFLQKRVAYYMMGDNTWKYADRIEDISNAKKIFYLHSEEGSAGDVFDSGELLETLPQKQEPDSFEYNPLNLIDKNNYLNPNPNYLTDQSEAFKEGKLIYQSAPLVKDIEIAGWMQFRVYLSMNVPDCDLTANVYEIQSDGSSIFLGSDIIRTRYRNSLEKEELVVPGEINLYNFNRFSFFARKIRKGSRLRLIVSTLNNPEFEKNYNSGGAIEHETGKDARTAKVTLYHDKKHPSVLELPVLE